MHLLMTGTEMTLTAWRDAGFGLQCIGYSSEGRSAVVRDQAAVVMHAYRVLHDVSLAV